MGNGGIGQWPSLPESSAFIYFIWVVEESVDVLTNVLISALFWLSQEIPKKEAEFYFLPYSRILASLP